MIFFLTPKLNEAHCSTNHGFFFFRGLKNLKRFKRDDDDDDASS